MDEKILEKLNSEFAEIKGIYAEKIKDKADATEVKALGEKLDAKFAEMQAQLDKVDKGLGDEAARQASHPQTWENAIMKAVGDNVEALKKQSTTKGMTVQFDLGKIDTKNVGTMTIANNLTGSSGVPTYAPGIVGLPPYPVHLNQLIATIPSATDLYHYIMHNETIGEGSFDYQTTGDAVKPQRDYDLTDVTVELKTLAAYTKVMRSMLRNVPALQSYLAQYLPEDYYQAEDEKGYKVLAASSYTTGSTAGGYDGLLATIGILGDAKYGVSAIVTRPSVIYNLMATKDDYSGYTVPGAIMVDNFGTLRVNGVPVIQAVWVPADTAVIGDWRYFKKIQSESLTVTSTEFDQDDFVRNRVTFRTEATIGFAVERPKAFSIIDMGFSA